MADFEKKDGLIYSGDLRTILGVDGSSSEFSGIVPYGAEKIDDNVFSDSPYEEIVLPDSIKEFGNAVFENSINLKTVKLPPEIKKLTPYLFSGCSSLKKVFMPESLTEFPEGLFYGCSSLEEIPFRAGIQELSESVFEGCSSLKSLVIPDSVSSIGKCACANCTSLSTVVLPAKLYMLEDDAFEGCNSIANIRISEDNHLFYVNEKDGCLYEKSIDGEDKLRLKICKQKSEKVDFFENEELLDTKEVENFFTNEQSDEIDEICSPEISVDFEENSEKIKEQKVNEKSEQENDMENKNSEIDNLFADIMGDEKNRKEKTEASVSISDRESEVLSTMMEVMNDSPANKGVSITDEELTNLFSKNEELANEPNSPAEDVSDGIDSKTKILIDSVEFSKIIENTPAKEIPSESDLFVIAENTVTEQDGTENFSEKLEKCVKKIARIQDFKRIILLKGLPLDNEEFMQFFHLFIVKKNVIVACKASSPATLSDYCKKICEESRISLDKDELTEQRKCISIKSNMLIKIIIQDI